MAVHWRLAGSFAAAVLVLAGTALILEHREAINPASVSYVWGSGRNRESPPPPDDMLLVPAGEYVIGDDGPNPASDAPLRRVRLGAFYIDRHEVTNREFARFVEAIGHVTTAEENDGAWIYRGGERDWQYVRDADWRHPLGPGSAIGHAMDHPVVVVSWYDAVAYAEWASKRLPTEVEWEVAARGGAPASPAGSQRIQSATPSNFSGGSTSETLGTGKLNVSNHPQAPAVGPHNAASPFQSNPAEDGSANVWQGHWPQKNEMTDGFFYTAPVGAFPANSFGISDMIGNVWEWTADWYASDTYRIQDPAHGTRVPLTGESRVARGGSWFCSLNYCSAFRPGFRGKSPPGHTFNNVGFRCARDADFTPE